jgi:hypothetical protein
MGLVLVKVRAQRGYASAECSSDNLLMLNRQMAAPISKPLRQTASRESATTASASVAREGTLGSVAFDRKMNAPVRPPSRLASKWITRCPKRLVLTIESWRTRLSIE